MKFISGAICVLVVGVLLTGLILLAGALIDVAAK